MWQEYGAGAILFCEKVEVVLHGEDACLVTRGSVFSFAWHGEGGWLWVVEPVSLGGRDACCQKGDEECYGCEEAKHGYSLLGSLSSLCF